MQSRQSHRYSHIQYREPEEGSDKYTDIWPHKIAEHADLKDHVPYSHELAQIWLPQLKETKPVISRSENEYAC